MVCLQCKTVWSIPERFRGELLTMGRYTHLSSFHLLHFTVHHTLNINVIDWLTEFSQSLSWPGRHHTTGISATRYGLLCPTLLPRGYQYCISSTYLRLACNTGTGTARGFPYRQRSSEQTWWSPVVRSMFHVLPPALAFPLSSSSSSPRGNASTCATS